MNGSRFKEATNKSARFKVSNENPIIYLKTNHGPVCNGSISEFYKPALYEL
jgi:hypothetical protein